MKRHLRTAVFELVLLMASWSFAGDIISDIVPPSVLFEALAINRDIPTVKKPKYRSPTALVPSPDKSTIYICEQTAKKIAVFDVATGQVTRHIFLPNEVTGCAVSIDGTKLFATIGSEPWPTGYVCVVNAASGAVTKRIPVGHYPRSPIMSPDGSRLYVANMFSYDVSVIDVATETELERLEAVREPYAMDITTDGKTLVVGNSLPDDRSTDSDFVSCKISIFDLEHNTLDTVRLTRGSHSVFGLAISPDDRYAFVTHMIGKFNLMASMVDRGWLHTNNIAVIDLQTKKFINDVSVDLSMFGMANPWDIKFTEDGKFMVIAHAGANELSFIDYQPFIDTVLARSAAGMDLQKEFTTMLESRKRVIVETKGPRELAMIGNNVYVAGYFDDVAATMEMHEVSLEADNMADETYYIGEPQAWTGERNGESNFYDGALCFQKWQSCHSCHPFTRPDALNWILGGGAIVAPKNAKSMLYSWWTPPTTWSGRRGHARESIVGGIQLELFREPTRVLTAPLDTFFMALKPMMSPKLVKGRLSESAKRGRDLYYNVHRTGKDSIDCQKCHPAPLFCDMKYWNAGLPDPFDNTGAWDTPHLAETWRTGPYGHLGDYWGLQEILEVPGHSKAFPKMTFEEIDDLIEYVKSL